MNVTDHNPNRRMSDEEEEKFMMDRTMKQAREGYTQMMDLDRYIFFEVLTKFASEGDERYFEIYSRYKSNLNT